MHAKRPIDKEPKVFKFLRDFCSELFCWYMMELEGRVARKPIKIIQD